jgi:phosphatidate cytidylyltransferase
MTGPSRWQDLTSRTVTGAALICAGILVVWLGGGVFAVVVAFVASVILWELLSMTDAARRGIGPIGLWCVAGLGGLALLLARDIAAPWSSALLLVPVLAGVLALTRERALFALYALAVLLAGFGLVVFRDGQGALWLFWLVTTIVATDLAGYFAGRVIGGPKFWPRISPKKTWAGIIAGWLAALCVAFVFLQITPSGPAILVFAVLLSFASQLGDVAESAFKRRMGVKDSSGLLPGHGGLFDRFDGLAGAALFLMGAQLLVDLPVFGL